jgi:hypothetical protein
MNNAFMGAIESRSFDWVSYFGNSRWSIVT